MKDNFSIQAAAYSKFRPTYPPELIAHIVSLTKAQNIAWDCATGNGQIAVQLSPYFKEIYATDISEKQLENATREPNIFYKKERAEKTNFPASYFDLITVGQAVHWFDFQLFNEEVRRVLKPGGIIALIGYGVFKSSPEIEKICGHFYHEIIGSYWDPERRYIDEAYRTIPFPFEEIFLPKYEMKYAWTLEELIGYLNTWSAVQHYIKMHGENPVEWVEKELRKVWHGEKVEVIFPLLTRIGIGDW
ncbi:MAG: class I SAM-dependent methyltransferase [Bacteroidota bacterium]